MASPYETAKQIKLDAAELLANPDSKIAEHKLIADVLTTIPTNSLVDVAKASDYFGPPQIIPKTGLRIPFDTCIPHSIGSVPFVNPDCKVPSIELGITNLGVSAIIVNKSALDDKAKTDKIVIPLHFRADEK